VLLRDSKRLIRSSSLPQPIQIGIPITKPRSLIAHQRDQLLTRQRIQTKHSPRSPEDGHTGEDSASACQQRVACRARHHATEG
jgi:hypothetical protein